MTSTVAATARPGIVDWVGSTDHKRTAARVATNAFLFFLAGGLLALLIRSELAVPGLQFLSEDAYNQLFTMHGSTMIYLVVTPFALALGVYLVPLQIGAAAISAPRLALLGDWLILGGGLTMWAGFLTSHGAAKAGWTAFWPLSSLSFSPGYGTDFWIFGVILATTGAILLAGCVLATIVRERAPGMTLLRMPPFTWTMLATCLMVLTSFPVLIVAMGLLFWGRHHGDVFEGSGGPIAYQHLFWFYGHPVVYVMFFPFVGAVADVIATFSRKRFFGYSAFVLSLLLFTALSMSVWAHHMFTTGQVTNQYFSLTSTLLLVPAGVEYFDFLGTMIGGRIALKTPMLFAVGFVLLFVIGGVTGIITASPPIDYHVHDSFFVVAHFHYTLFAGSLFGLFAAIYYWFPKATGVLLREGLGRIHFALMFIGANLTFFPMFQAGYEGMQRRVSDYPDVEHLKTLNELSTIGSYVLALGVLVFLANLVASLRQPVVAGNDPWEAQTLEWWTTSPPPRFNFDAALPPVRSHAPLLDRRLGEA